MSSGSPRVSAHYYRLPGIRNNGDRIRIVTGMPPVFIIVVANKHGARRQAEREQTQTDNDQDSHTTSFVVAFHRLSRHELLLLIIYRDKCDHAYGVVLKALPKWQHSEMRFQKMSV
jgi:hypothetical protein